MNEKKEALLEQLERMREGAEDLQRQGIKYYAMHAECAVKFATEAIELLAETNRRFFRFVLWDKSQQGHRVR